MFRIRIILNRGQGKLASDIFGAKIFGGSCVLLSGQNISDVKQNFRSEIGGMDLAECQQQRFASTFSVMDHGFEPDKDWGQF